MTRYLIVNADDFSLTAGVSRGILAAHREGIVTSTTALVNLSGIEAARELSAAAPRLALGLHLNLTLGRPVTPPRACPTLVDADGCFLREPERFAAGGAAAEILGELTAQAEAFARHFGRAPTHLDSHHHVHRHPVVLEAVLALARGLRLPVRPPAAALVPRLRREGVPCVDRTLGDIGEEALRDAGRLAGLLAALDEGVTELICHPGYHDAALAGSRYGPEREQERAVLCAPEVRSALTGHGIRLIGYGELAAARAERP